MKRGENEWKIKRKRKNKKSSWLDFNVCSLYSKFNSCLNRPLASLRNVIFFLCLGDCPLSGNPRWGVFYYSKSYSDVLFQLWSYMIIKQKTINQNKSISSTCSFQKKQGKKSVKYLEALLFMGKRLPAFLGMRLK